MLSLSACSLTNKRVASAKSEQSNFTVQLLGINDFHGQTLPIGDEGGILNLSNHLLAAIESSDEHTFILHGGDHVGASPAESALLQDEPAIDFLNILQNHCRLKKENACQIIGTAGNHEFDEGSDEMLRLLNGGNHANGPFIHSPWQGSNYQTLSANVVDKESQSLLLEPYSVHIVNDVPIGFIGITLDTTPELVVPGIVENLNFKDQSEAVRFYANELQQQGVKSIVVIVHDGTEIEYYPGPTQESIAIPADSQFAKFLNKLPNTVDVVVSGHSHEFTNTYYKNETGKSLLVTQAFSSGRAYSDISITIDPISKDIVESSAEVIFTKSSTRPRLNKSSSTSLNQIKHLVAKSTEYAKEYTLAVLNTYVPVESEIHLGQFIADAHKYMLKTNLAVMNDGGVRAELQPGDITWGQLFAVQPFGNPLVIRRYTGEQLLNLIDTEHFWSSGTSISADGAVTINSTPVNPNASYTVGGNGYIMNSQGFTVGELILVRGIDVEETATYIKSLPNPFNFLDVPTQ